MPRAITVASCLGNRNSDHIYTGSVTSVPVKKKAIMNSSSDKVNPISKLAIMPGKTNGNITL